MVVITIDVVVVVVFDDYICIEYYLKKACRFRRSFVLRRHLLFTVLCVLPFSSSTPDMDNFFNEKWVKNNVKNQKSPINILKLYQVKLERSKMHM